MFYSVCRKKTVANTLKKKLRIQNNRTYKYELRKKCRKAQLVSVCKPIASCNADKQNTIVLMIIINVFDMKTDKNVF